MRKRPWYALLVAVSWTGFASAQSISPERVQLHLTGLSVVEICSVVPGFGKCFFPDVGGGVVEVQLEGPLGIGVHGGITDAVGSWYGADVVPRLCNGTTAQDARIYRMRADGAVELVLTLLGCLPSDPYPVQFSIVGLTLDAVNGTLLFSLGYSYAPPTLLELRGLPTLLDIIPTFQPATETLGWVAPKHPEALPAADRFMVYTGSIADLRTSGFSSAVPVACSIPEGSVPKPGDFLSILDPLPEPPPGQGSYAIIGVEYAGQRRFGRQNVGGVLAGRELSAFHGCT